MNKQVEQILRRLLYDKKVVMDVQLYHIDQLVADAVARVQAEEEELSIIAQLIEDKRLDKLMSSSLYFQYVEDINNRKR